MKKILVAIFVFISALSFGQTRINLSRGGGSSSSAAPIVTVSSSTTLTLSTTGGYVKTYIYNGSATATWTLPAISASTTGQIIKIKNIGTGALTVQGGGANLIYTNATVLSVVLINGDAQDFQDDGTYWITN